MRLPAYILAVLGLSFIAAPYTDANGKDTVEPPAIQAPIALLVDMSSGQTLYAKEADRRFIPASITKVMTAYLAFELMASGQLGPDQMLSIRPETHEEWSGTGSTMFLPADEPVKVDDLLNGITTVSANDASIVLAEGAKGSVADWVSAMNDTARSIGMANSHFGTPNGWPDDGKTFVTARDLVRLADAMITGHEAKYAHYFGNTGFRYGDYAQANHDPLSGKYDGADGIKTGFTNEAGFGYLGSAMRDGRRLTMVIAGAPSEQQRAALARALMDWGFGAFDLREIYTPGQLVSNVRVQNGSEDTIGLTVAKPLRLSIPQGTNPKVAMKIHYWGPLRAPIADGEQVAELEISIEGMPTSRIPLVAMAEVNKANIFQSIMSGFKGWIS